MIQKFYSVDELPGCFYDGKDLQPVEEYIEYVTKGEAHPHCWLSFANDGRVFFNTYSIADASRICEELKPNCYIINDEVLTQQEFVDDHYLTTDPRFKDY